MTKPSARARLDAALGAFLDAEPPPRAALVACSGGLDSTVLARVLTPLLVARGARVWIAHLDHSLRGRGGAADAAAASALAAELGVPIVRRTERPSAALTRAVGLQAAARSVRRDFLRDVARAVGASVCFLGHHEDDQVETLRIQEARGRRPDAIVGMPARAGAIARPLLGTKRALLLEAARDAGWSWREDPSNSDPRFLRARVRRSAPLAPSDRSGLLLRGLNRRARRTYLWEASRRAAGRVVVSRAPDEVVLDRSELMALPEEIGLVLLQQHTQTSPGRPPSVAAIRGLLRCAGRPADGATRTVALGAGWTAEVAQGSVCLLRGERKPRPVPAVGVARVPAGVGRGLLAGSEARIAVFDAESVGPVTVGRVGSARSMRPFGLGGTRLLRDLLSEARVPARQRADWPTVESSDGEVIWLPGSRRSEHHPLTRSSAEALVLYTVAPRVDETGGKERSP